MAGGGAVIFSVGLALYELGGCLEDEIGVRTDLTRGLRVLGGILMVIGMLVMGGPWFQALQAALPAVM